MSFMEVTCGKMEDARRKRAAQLPRLGWKQDGAYWINPRSGRKCDRAMALIIEDLRGTFVKERMAIYNAKRDHTGRKRGRPPKVNGTGI